VRCGIHGRWQSIKSVGLGPQPGPSMLQTLRSARMSFTDPPPAYTERSSSSQQASTSSRQPTANASSSSQTSGTSLSRQITSLGAKLSKALGSEPNKSTDTLNKDGYKGSDTSAAISGERWFREIGACGGVNGDSGVVPFCSTLRLVLDSVLQLVRPASRVAIGHLVSLSGCYASLASMMQ
jgi:hypothetical protein